MPGAEGAGVELVNATAMQSGYTLGVRADGRELLVVAAKGTFLMPEQGEEARLSEEQVPLCETDEFAGEPGCSAPVREMDFAPHKPRCDVLLNGSAHAPRGRPAARVGVSLRVGSWSKSFDVVGDRVWQAGAAGIGGAPPEPFTAMPISYGNAFGGIDRSSPDESDHHHFRSNPVGVGYHKRLDRALVEGRPLPNTERRDAPVSRPNGNYPPMAFGPVGRGWSQRVRFAGTYDQAWLDDVFPFLPSDFRPEYHQAAPQDQWIDFPKGGEEVELVNLSPRGRAVFRLPGVSVPFEFIYKDGARRQLPGVIDTLLIEPDAARFTMTWRAALPLRRGLHEVGLIVAGRLPAEGAVETDRGGRLLGKPRYRSLAELVAAGRARQG